MGRLEPEFSAVQEPVQANCPAVSRQHVAMLARAILFNKRDNT